MDNVQFGLDTFGDVTVDLDGQRVHDAVAIRQVVEQAVLADQVGVDFFGVGEHHRDDFAVSAPELVLAAIEPFVYEWVAKEKGSVSAEHGLGIAKKPFVGYSKDETMLKLMRQIKELYDPNGIMNPYKYI